MTKTLIVPRCRQEREMTTDEKRQKLCKALRRLCAGGEWWPTIYEDAADEIERLANAEAVWKGRAEAYLKIANDEAALSQSDAEPGQETPSAHSLGLAAQAWCEPETSHKEMDEALCKAFARILDRALAQSDTEPVAWRWHFCADIEWHVTNSEREAIHRQDEGCTVEPLYNAEPQDIWRQSAETVARDNASLRRAGTALAEAALQVIREYDGTHRLALAVAEWSKVVANEGGRAALAQSDAEPRGGDATVTGPMPSDPNKVTPGPSGSAKSLGPQCGLEMK